LGLERLNLNVMARDARDPFAQMVLRVAPFSLLNSPACRIEKPI
jgi:hypothetical protein